MESDQYNTSEVAQKAGVHKDTLLRWLREGIIPEPSRNRFGWRVFTEDEANLAVGFAQSKMRPNLDSSINSRATNEISKLENIDWAFSDAKTNYLTHGMHPYPAKFIPQIPNALIQELSTVGETILDIFCGSGTTLLEALILKRHAIGIDANPLACLISQAKTACLSEVDCNILDTLIQRAKNLTDTLSVYQEDSLFGPQKFKSDGWRPDDPSLDFWFEKGVIEELAEILSWCNGLQSESSRLIALTSISSIIVTVSLQDSDTRYVRRTRKFKIGEVVARFAKSLQANFRAAIELSDLVEPRFNSKIFCSNLLNSPQIEKAHLVVCSPPYPNAYSYHLYHKHRMLWLQMDQPKFKADEIGSHRKYSKKKNGADENTFMQEMKIIFRWLSNILDKKRYACFVVGNSRIQGRVINNADILADAAAESGFVEVSRISRKLLDTKKSFNPKIGNIKSEQILILQNSNGN